MTALGKDSPEVVEFMAAFAQLKEWCDDAPDDLIELAGSDESVGDLCNRVSNAAFLLTRNERKHRALIAAPVDPAFVAEWRDYEKRYRFVLADIWLSQLLGLEDLGHSSPPNADLRWDNADFEAKEQAGGIEQAIDFAQENADQDHRWSDDLEDFIEDIREGIAAWDRFKEETGFDLRGVFRRRALIPFVLVPRRVADKHGSAEKLSLLKNLQQAHESFIYGASYGALALMRSILEAVLRDHYRVEGRDLEQRIQNARGRLPRGVNSDRLHRLRRLSNAILHLDREKADRFEGMDDAGLEKEIVEQLFVLRALIEGVE